MRTITRVITNRLLKRLPVPDRDRLGVSTPTMHYTMEALSDASFGGPRGRVTTMAPTRS